MFFFRLVTSVKSVLTVSKSVSESQTSLPERLVTLKIEPPTKFTHARSLRAQALAWSNLVLKQRNILKCIKGDGHSKTTE